MAEQLSLGGSELKPPAWLGPQPQKLPRKASGWGASFYFPWRREPGGRDGGLDTKSHVLSVTLFILPRPMCRSDLGRDQGTQKGVAVGPT